MSHRTGSFFRSNEPAGRLVRPAGFAMLMAFCAATAAPAVSAQPAAQAVAAGSTSAFSSSRDEQARPAWFAYGDARAAEQLILLLRSAELDGLDPDRFDPDRLERAKQAAIEGRFRDVETAERMFDEALVRYVAALRRNPSAEWVVVDRAAAPSTLTNRKILAEAAGSLFLDRYIERLGFMHPLYGELRRALATVEEDGDQRAADLIRLNLKRVRLLPGSSGRYVLVNTAAQRLYMYEDGREVGSMKVVVGKPEQPTPMMAGMIRFTAVNPYWNLPVDLVAERVAPHVLKDPSYLQQKGYVVLSDFTDDATPVSASDIDWQAVADGTVKLRVRQEPGPGNAMGRMKFMFPNSHGVYLHDTPDKQLLTEDARLFSAGCVRLEDAPRLAEWLYGKPLETEGAKPEQHVDLDKPVPVYLAYLTAVPSGGGEVTFHDDIYGRDAAQLELSDRDRLARR